jgi:hypothetical protein
MSTGGKAPRKQLASKAARKSAPSSVSVEQSMRKREGEDILPVKKNKGKKTKRSANNVAAQGARAEEEDDDEDEDMGFGLFDGSPGRSKVSETNLRANDIPVIAATQHESSAQTMALDDGTAKTKEKAKETGTLLEQLIAGQSFEGSWGRISERLFDEMKIDRDGATTAEDKLIDASKQTLDKTKANDIMTTAIVVIFLENRMEEEEETWELVVEKARNWLEDAVVGDVLSTVWKYAKSIVGV